MIIPYRKPLSTIWVWQPIKVLSRITSRHHWIIVKTTNIKPNNKQNKPLLWNQKTKPIAVKKAPKEPVNGQGLASTKWKGCRSIMNKIYHVHLLPLGKLKFWEIQKSKFWSHQKTEIKHFKKK